MPQLQVLQLVDAFSLGDDEVCTLLRDHGQDLVSLQLSYSNHIEDDDDDDDEAEEAEEAEEDENEDEDSVYSVSSSSSDEREHATSAEVGPMFSWKGWSQYLPKISCQVLKSISSSCSNLQQLYLSDAVGTSRWPRFTLYDLLPVAKGCPGLQVLRLNVEQLEEGPWEDDNEEDEKNPARVLQLTGGCRYVLLSPKNKVWL
jgi:hypothetical protein